MPKGFTPGEYAFCIVKNLETRREKPKSLREDGDEMYCRAQPVLSMSALMDHLQRYAKDNGWKEDDAEKALHAMVRNAPTTMANIEHDAKSWPFSGDQCFLAWTSVWVQKSMLIRTSTSKSRIGDLSWDNPNTDMATHLGRWFAQRPYISEMADPIVKHLVRYVQTIASMPERDYFIFSGRHDANHVMQCEATADNGTSRIVGKLSNVPRPVCSEEGYAHQWSDKAFGAFVMGMAWEMRARGEGLAFERLNALVNKGNTCTSNALALLQWEDIAWRNAAMERIVEAAKPSVHAIVQGNTNMAFLDLYPEGFHWRLREAHHNDIVKACLAQDPRSQWAQAVFKLAVASALRETFLPSSMLDYDSHGRVQAMGALLDKIDPEQRDALFVQFVQALEHVGNETAGA